jgi:hypothetical protein
MVNSEMLSFQFHDHDRLFLCFTSSIAGCRLVVDFTVTELTAAVIVAVVCGVVTVNDCDCVGGSCLDSCGASTSGESYDAKRIRSFWFLKSTPDFNRGVVFRQQLFALSQVDSSAALVVEQREIINLGNNLFVAICCFD